MGLQEAAVETLGGELSDERVHAVLEGEEGGREGGMVFPVSWLARGQGLTVRK